MQIFVGILTGKTTTLDVESLIPSTSLRQRSRTRKASLLIAAPHLGKQQNGGTLLDYNIQKHKQIKQRNCLKWLI
jgi:hypothetical protein